MALPNIQHSDKWQIIFSNIPGFVPSISGNTNDMNIYDLYVKSVSFPSLKQEIFQSHLRGYQINHPGSKINDGLNEITVTFKLSEGMLNYYYIFNWLKRLREGENIDKEKFFRLNTIKELKVIFLDNEKRPKWKYIMKEGFVSNLGDLNLTNGVDDELSFSITVSYEDFEMVVGEC